MNRMGVVGCGVMGAGIAEIGAKGGCDVVVVDAFPEALERAKSRMAASLAKAEEKGKLSEPADVILGRIRWSSDLADLADREFVTEAIRELLEDKVALISQLDEILSPEAIIATNTSSIPRRADRGCQQAPGACPRHSLLQPGSRHAAGRGCLRYPDRSDRR